MKSKGFRKSIVNTENAIEESSMVMTNKQQYLRIEKYLIK